jgi:hypothetical protein
MELYIRIKDGQPFEHPIFGDNFRQAFPDIDTNNLPAEFAKFERVERPILGAYEVMTAEEPTYELNGAVYKDIWHKRDMTAEEIAAKQQAVKDAWALNGFASWVFNETTCAFEAPTPQPIDGKIYRWDEPTTSWIEVTNV